MAAAPNPGDGYSISGRTGVDTMTVLLTPTTYRHRPAAPRARPGAGLALEVERRLRRSGYLALRDVSGELHAGTVRLRGRLPTYYLKQVAQAIVSEIAGVHQVINHIEIVAPTGRPPLGREGEGIMVATGSIPTE
jgi:hypothetical protein